MSEGGKHHPNLMSAGRHGSWCSCPCGWSSGTYGTVVAAHLAFGRHLVNAERKQLERTTCPLRPLYRPLPHSGTAAHVPATPNAHKAV